MINGINLATINFEVYRDGDNRLLGTSTVDLPEIAFATTDIKGSGILGTLSYPIKGNFDNLEVTLHWRTLTAAAVTFLNQTKAQRLSLRQAAEVEDAGSGERGVSAVRIDVVGHTTKLAPGKLEPGEQTETELTLALTRIKITIDGKEVLEIDKLNSVFLVDGEDQLSDVRAALGL